MVSGVVHAWFYPGGMSAWHGLPGVVHPWVSRASCAEVPGIAALPLGSLEPHLGIDERLVSLKDIVIIAHVSARHHRVTAQ